MDIEQLALRMIRLNFNYILNYHKSDMTLFHKSTFKCLISRLISSQTEANFDI